MYVSPAKKKRYVIIAIISFLLVPVSIGAFFIVRDWRSRASATAEPKDVRISDLTESSVVISWITSDKETEGWIRYGKESDVNDGSPIAQDDRDVRSGNTTQRTTHYVTISDLDPGQKYYFVIGSGSKVYQDEGGGSFDFTTADSSTSGTAPTPTPVYGTITNGENQGAIVYITLEKDGSKSFPVSSLTNDSGNFEVDIAHVRTASLSEIFGYDESTKLTVFAQGGDKGGVVYVTSVGEAEKLELTMDQDYSTTDVFADDGEDAGDTGADAGSGSTSGGTSSGGGTTPTDDTSGDDQTDDGQDTSGDYVKSKDVPLTSLVLGTSDTTGIENIKKTNITENSFTVVWESGSKEEGYVTYGTVETELVNAAYDDRDGLSDRGTYYMHHVSVTDLVPETTYYFKINSGGVEYDDSGSPYQVMTPATQDTPPEYDSVLGEINGTGKNDAVIVAKVVGADGESSEISTVPDDNGRWTLSIGGVRSQDYSGYFSYDSEDSLEITGMTKGDEDSITRVIGDIGEDVLSISLEMIESTGGDEAFERGLYDSVGSLDNLPVTAISRIAFVAIAVSVVFLIYGTYMLIRLYYGDKGERWEKSVLQDMDL